MIAIPTPHSEPSEHIIRLQSPWTLAKLLRTPLRIELMSVEGIAACVVTLPPLPQYRYIDDPREIQTCPHCDQLVKGAGEFWCSNMWHPQCLADFHEEWGLRP